jgi:hypothetical protein
MLKMLSWAMCTSKMVLAITRVSSKTLWAKHVPKKVLTIARIQK